MIFEWDDNFQNVKLYHDIKDEKPYEIIEIEDLLTMWNNRLKGKWLNEHEDGHGSWVGTCSQCHKIEKVTNYCPHCGADMKGENK